MPEHVSFRLQLEETVGGRHEYWSYSQREEGLQKKLGSSPPIPQNSLKEGRNGKAPSNSCQKPVAEGRKRSFSRRGWCDLYKGTLPEPYLGKCGFDLLLYVLEWD